MVESPEGGRGGARVAVCAAGEGTLLDLGAGLGAVEAGHAADGRRAAEGVLGHNVPRRSLHAIDGAG